MSFSQRLNDIKTGFERPFWVANITELFERLSYYAAFASLSRYLHENLQLPVERATTLSGLFGFVWILAAVGGTIADRLGFRRALSVAYLILSFSYFLLGSVNAPWLGPVRSVVPLIALATFAVLLPALGVALVKPAVVGTTARASKENVRSIGFSIYYTLVNVGGLAGPYMSSWVHHRMAAENVFYMSAVSVFIMFFAVLIFFKEPRRTDEPPPPDLKQTLRNFGTVLLNFRFMAFLVIFSGYWIVYWQEFISLPIYVHDFIDAKADTDLMLVTGPAIVIAFTMAVSILAAKMKAFSAVTLGTLISAVAWILLIILPTVKGAILTLVVVAAGELLLSPRYYEYVSRLAPPGQQGTYMGFAFLPIGIGSMVAGPFSGILIHQFGEVQHRPQLTWWVITGVGLMTALLLWIYDKKIKPAEAEASPK